MDLLRRTNQHYWKVKNGRAAFSNFLTNTFAEDVSGCCLKDGKRFGWFHLDAN
jgi:hypothetical protein